MNAPPPSHHAHLGHFYYLFRTFNNREVRIRRDRCAFSQFAGRRVQHEQPEMQRGQQTLRAKQEEFHIVGVRK